MHIYTDGSKSAECSGSAFFIPSQNAAFSFPLGNSPSSFTTELYALWRAVDWIAQFCPPKAVIFSDCLGALKSLQRIFVCKHHITRNIITLLNTLMQQQIVVVFCWIPGHVGLPGNEKADSLAKSPTGTSVELNVTKWEAKSLMASLCKQKWIDYYIAGDTGRYFKQLFPDVNDYDDAGCSSRKEECVLLRLQTGHCRLNQHLYRIKCSDTPNCEVCDVPESVKHFLLECNRHNLQRNRLSREAHNIGISMDIKNLLTDIRLRKAVFEYVENTGKLI